MKTVIIKTKIASILTPLPHFGVYLIVYHIWRMNVLILILNLANIFQNKELDFAVRGYCPEDCNAFMHYLIFAFIVHFFMATGRVGNTIINLRLVEQKQDLRGNKTGL